MRCLRINNCQMLSTCVQTHCQCSFYHASCLFRNLSTDHFLFSIKVCNLHSSLFHSYAESQFVTCVLNPLLKALLCYSLQIHRSLLTVVCVLEDLDRFYLIHIICSHIRSSTLLQFVFSAVHNDLTFPEIVK
ncbi:hypothetical protein M3Y97_00659800 [Aphelenchoides bicaudatus]|nr:hypothetical protein M3Y97_00659800 [Aphelenchoides bicaudatus]